MISKGYVFENPGLTLSLIEWTTVHVYPTSYIRAVLPTRLTHSLRTMAYLGMR